MYYAKQTVFKIAFKKKYLQIGMRVESIFFLPNLLRVDMHYF